MQGQTHAPITKDGKVHIKPSLVKHSTLVYNVYKTNDYGLFKIMGENRDTNFLHVKRLVESFNERYLISPIIVNEKMEVIDGQHRLAAAMETRKPIYYIVIPGYGIREVQILNTNQKNWNKVDFLKLYVEHGAKPYLEFKKFMEDFPELSFQACERLIRLTNIQGKKVNIEGATGAMKDFQEGKLVIPNLVKSYQYAKKIMDFKQFYPSFHRGVFISAMIPLFGHKNYHHSEMIYKMGVCPAGLKLKDSSNVDGYREQLENIYNWKRLRDNKVSFKYLN